MNENLEASLEEAAKEALEELHYEKSSDDRAARLKEIESLIKTRNELVRTEAEVGFKEDELEAEKAKRKNDEERLKADKWNMWLRIGLGVLELGVPLVYYGHRMHELMRFEATGHAPSSPAFRMFLKEIRPKK